MREDQTPFPVPDAVLTDEDMRHIARAHAEVVAGKGVPHARVREWLERLARGETVPPPQA